MAITTNMISSFGRSEYDLKYRNYTGIISNFFQVDSGYSPNSFYFVGYTFDNSNGNLGGISVNGNVINETYTAGAGSFRKTSGVGLVAVGNGGLLTWQGFGSTGIQGAMKTFAVRVQ